MNQPMTLERLREICDAYGHDARRWPQQERAEAEALVAASAAARSLLNETANLDQWLDQEPVIAPSRALHARIMNSAPRRKQSFLTRIFPAAMTWNELGNWRFAIPVFIAIVLGAALGNAYQDSLDQSDMLQLAVFQNDVEGY